jgi:hypothetical protein
LADLSRLYYAAGAGLGSGFLAVGTSSADAVLLGSMGGTVAAVGWTGVGLAAVGGYALGTAIERPVNNAVASFFQVFTDIYYRNR